MAVEEAESTPEERYTSPVKENNETRGRGERGLLTIVKEIRTELVTDTSLTLCEHTAPETEFLDRAPESVVGGDRSSSEKDDVLRSPSMDGSCLHTGHKSLPVHIDEVQAVGNHRIDEVKFGSIENLVGANGR
jgi:hypothetical protein